MSDQRKLTRKVAQLALGRRWHPSATMSLESQGCDSESLYSALGRKTFTFCFSCHLKVSGLAVYSSKFSLQSKAVTCQFSTVRSKPGNFQASVSLFKVKALQAEAP